MNDTVPGAEGSENISSPDAVDPAASNEASSFSHRTEEPPPVPAENTHKEENIVSVTKAQENITSYAKQINEACNELHDQILNVAKSTDSGTQKAYLMQAASRFNQVIFLLKDYTK